MNEVAEKWTEELRHAYSNVLSEVWRKFTLRHLRWACKGCQALFSADKWGRFPNGRRICPSCHKSKGILQLPGILELGTTIIVPKIENLSEDY